MTSLTKKQSFGLATVFATILFLIKSAFLWTAPLRGLGITTWIIDDTFIIMRVARNIALGHGFSFDGIHPTTGAPPLWTYMTAVNHMMFSLEGAVKSTFIETTLFASLATLVIFLIARKVTGKESAAWIAFILSSLTGNAFFEAMNGMDTSLFTFMTVLTIAVYVDVWNVGGMKKAVLTGALAGITTLVRGDGIFLIGTLGLLMLCKCVRAQNRKNAFGETVVFALTSGVFFALLIGWQEVFTGSPMLANQVGRREIAMSLQGFDFNHFVLGKYLKIVVWNVFQLENLIDLATGSAMFALFALLLGWAKKEMRELATVTAIYSASFFGMLVAYQWYFPDLHGLRYVNPSVHLLFVFIGATIAMMPEGRVWRFCQAITVAAFILFSQYWFYNYAIHFVWARGLSYTAHPTKDEETSAWATIDWVKANLPEGTVIGVRDHGRFSLFSDRPVQDLAGNIDPMVPKLARTTGLAAYLKSQKVQYLLIPSLDVRQDLIYKVLFRDLKLEIVKAAPSYRGTSLYKIIW